MNKTNFELLKIPNFLSSEQSSIIYERILKQENYVKSLGENRFDNPGIANGKEKLTQKDSLTGRDWCFNWLNDEVVGKIIIPKIRIVFGGKGFIQCWANTFRKGEGIARHKHRDPMVSFSTPKDWTCVNLFIGGPPGLGTWFEGQKHENNPGELMLFSSNVYHWVPPNDTDDVRISIAMDVHSRMMSGFNDDQWYSLKP